MSSGHIQAAALQFSVSMEVARNVAALESLLDPLPAETFAVSPEGALSGYLPKPGVVSRSVLEFARGQSPAGEAIVSCGEVNGSIDAFGHCLPAIDLTHRDLS